MARPSTALRSNSSERARLSSLAGIIGHELNNIAVPLNGFAELALQTLAPQDAQRQNFDELQIGIDRIKALALDLVSLGESETVKSRVAIDDCISPADGAAPIPHWQIEWSCKASTPVTLDVLHARRAVHALALMASSSTRADVAPIAHLAVALAVPPGARCAVCGRALDRKRKSVCILAHSPRNVGPAVLREPFGPAPIGRNGRRLTLAVLAHAAHCAGGHVVLDEAAGRLALVFRAS